MQVELTIERGREPGRRYVVRVAQQFVIGRGYDVSIYVDDDKVSRRHAVVELRPDGWPYVTDLASRNGTLLAGRPLPANEPTRLSHDDRIEVGEHVLRVELTGIDEKAKRERARTQRLDEPVLPRDEYELLGEIGHGATGRVYAARQRLLGRTVAVKVLRQEVGDDEESRQRFLREGQICCRIKSPYVVEVFDVRLVKGRVFMVMELINGPSAKDRLSGGPIPIPEALKIGEDVANGVAAAHAAGAIHRDIKPANILLSPEGIAKLSDFGIAKDLDAVVSLTAAGEGLGTLAYVSPEQATEAREVDPRTDLYSLGATLYHFVAGRPPFLPKNARVLLEILDAPAPPLQPLRPECPADVTQFIHRLLAKSPAERPTPAALVARTLRQLREAHYPNYIPAGGGATDPRRMNESTETEGGFIS